MLFEPTRVFYDCEFLDNGRTIALISIGMVDDEGGEPLYLINSNAPWAEISEHSWLAGNVLPHLPGKWVYDYGDRRLWEPDHSHAAVRPREQVAALVASWLAERALNAADRRVTASPTWSPGLGLPTLDDAVWTDLELWAYYGAYDHVALAQLFGPMASFPRWLPMFTHDLCQLAEQRGVAVGDLHKRVSQLTGSEHNALDDADWNRRVHAYLTSGNLE